MTIRALCITEDPDRPTIAMFVGLHRAGVDLAVVCPPASEARGILEAEGIRIVDLELRDRVDKQGIRALRDELRRGRYDILHLLGNKGLQNGLIAARGMSIRIVAYRGIVGNVSFFNPVSWKRFLNPRIDRIVCVADAVRDYFLRMRPAFLRIPEERLVTIHKGHRMEWYTDEPADLSELSIPPDAFIVGCVANYRPRKGIELLIDALAELPAEHNVHLVLVGHMSAPELDKKIRTSPIADRIHRTGYRKDAPALSAACDVFVLPSTKREGLARSLIEAMAYGVAPIVTDCGGSPEVVIHGESGLVVPVRDASAIAGAIRRLHDSPELRRRLGEGARERISTAFRSEDTIEKTLAVYRSLVDCG